METKEASSMQRKAFWIIILLIVTWGIAITPFFEDYSSGNNAAGSGMAKGFALLFVTVPCMAIIFVSNLFFVFKTDIALRYRLFSMANYLGLFILFNEVNW